MLRLTIALLLAQVTVAAPACLAWHDATHMAVVKAAGLDDFAYLAVGADMAKEKSGGYEDPNHYCNVAKGVTVTPEMVLDQVRDYDCRCLGGDGHLFGAVVAAVNRYRESRKFGKYGRYQLGFAAHYIGDLSMPLHNIAYDDFNRANHAANDGVVEGAEDEPLEAKLTRIAAGIGARMKLVPPYRLPPAQSDAAAFTRELAKKVAEIANRSIGLGYSLRDGVPQRTRMTEEEAYRQLAESATLLRAVHDAL